jgi:hypothetical protein
MAHQIPADFAAAAYTYGGEFAWPRDAALEVVDWATKSGLAVFGGEIWIPGKEGPIIPSPYIYTFSTDPEEFEPWEDFVLRANRIASEYISTFEWDSNDIDKRAFTPYFNLTIDSE